MSRQPSPAERSSWAEVDLLVQELAQSAGIGNIEARAAVRLGWVIRPRGARRRRAGLVLIVLLLALAAVVFAFLR